MVVELTFKQLAFLLLKRATTWLNTTNNRLLDESFVFFDDIHSIIDDELKNELGSNWEAEFLNDSRYSGVSPSQLQLVFDKLKNPKRNQVYGVDFTDSEFELFSDALSIYYRTNVFASDDMRRQAAEHINELWYALEDEIRRSVRV